MSDQESAPQGWHLDRRIPVVWLLGLVAMGIAQALAVGAWVASVDARTDENRRMIDERSVAGERRFAQIELRQDETRRALPRIEQILMDIQRRLDRMEPSERRQ